LKIFDEVGMAYLRRRSLILTAYLEAIIKKNYEEKKGGPKILIFLVSNAFNKFK
jgi:hypothetical protein